MYDVSVGEEKPPEIGFAQWQGTRRSQNDVISISGFSPVKGQMIVLADGIGIDRSAGEAALTVAETIRRDFEQGEPDENPYREILRMLGNAHTRVLALNGQAAVRGDLPVGISVVCAVVRDRKLSFGAVGNARIFLLRNGRLLQLNRDHLLSLEAEERDILAGEAPELDPEWAMRVTAYIGMERLKQIDWQDEPISLHSRDVILLMSSGLYGVLTEETLVGILDAFSPQEAAERIIGQAQEACQASQSNISLAVMRIGSPRRRGIQSQPVWSG